MKSHSYPLPVERSGRASLLAACALVVALAGCASSAGIEPVAQTLTPAQVGLASAASDPAATTAIEQGWWRAWGDDRLTRLIDSALQAHPSLKVAQARLARAEAAVSGEDAAAGPKLGLSADATRQRYSATSIYPPPLGGGTRTLANAQLAGSWEIDFFGRHQAAFEAALGAERAAQADLQAARNLLSSQVAQTYVQLGRLVAQREVAQRALAQREDMLGLIRERVNAGLDSRVELRQGEGALPDARLQIEQIEEQMTLARHALAALTAVPPETYASLAPQLTGLKPAPVPTALPADLLGRRADIVAARWRMEAATQGVKAAKAQFYPNVNLTAFIGLSSIGLNELVKADSRQYGLGPAIHLPIFDSGALRAQLRGKTAELDGAVESYNGAVLDAVRDTADQLQSLRSIERQQTEQAQAQAAAESAYDIATQRYRAGLSSHLVVLNAESALLNQRRLAVDLQARVLSAQVALIRALGGGYTDAPPAA